MSKFFKVTNYLTTSMLIYIEFSKKI